MLRRSARLRPSVFSLALLLAIAPELSAQASEVPPAQVFADFREATHSNARTVAIESMVVERDAGRFDLGEGSLTFIELDGTPGAVVFQGTGTFSLQPRRRIDRAQLDRLHGDEAPTIPLRSVVFFGGPEVMADLDTGSSGAEIESDAAELARRALDHVADRDARWFDPAVVDALVNQRPAGFLHGHIEPVDGDDLWFRWDEDDVEEVSFGRATERGGDPVYVTEVSFNPSDQTEEVAAGEVARSPLSTMQVSTDLAFDGGMRVTGSSTSHAISNVDGGTWVPFSLHPELEVLSVTWGDGTAADFHAAEDASQLWVRTPATAGAGSVLSLTTEYRGRVGEWRGDWFFQQTVSGWYPSAAGTKATFDMTFRTPEEVSVVAMGERIEEEVVDGTRVSRWVRSTPFPYAGFNVGRFRTWDFDHDFIPPVRIHMNQRAHEGLPLAVQQDNPQDYVSNDVSVALSFFQTQMGALPNPEFSVTEIPYAHGQAFPGMIHLSFATFGMSREVGVNEVFRAHEVAHQWWGINVAPRTYRDRWLAEGMAEFSALWFLEVLRGDTEESEEVWRRYRDRIRDRRGEAGPTAMGTRVLVDGADDDYQRMVYEKGAFIGHMLRHLMYDYANDDETVFRTFLTEVHERFRNRRMSTDDFRQVVERYVGGDMGWFFEQWVDGTDVPDYRFAWESVAGQDGSPTLRVRVRQENVADDFQMIVPLYIDFGEGRGVVVRILVSGPETVQEIALPLEAVDVLLNPFEAVLATVRTESW